MTPPPQAELAALRSSEQTHTRTIAQLESQVADGRGYMHRLTTHSHRLHSLSTTLHSALERLVPAGGDGVQLTQGAWGGGRGAGVAREDISALPSGCAPRPSASTPGCLPVIVLPCVREWRGVSVDPCRVRDFVCTVEDRLCVLCACVSFQRRFTLAAARRDTRVAMARAAPAALVPTRKVGREGRRGGGPRELPRLNARLSAHVRLCRGCVGWPVVCGRPLCGGRHPHPFSKTAFALPAGAAVFPLHFLPVPPFS
jgi:hypothetical protein